MEGSLSTALFESSRFRLGRFDCGPESPRWRTVNEIPPAPHVAFGGTNVVIRHDGREPVLGNRNHAVFYEAGQRYRRRLFDPAGDHCLYVELASDLAAELAGAEGFGWADGPVAARDRVALELAARHAAAGAPDRLALEETIVGVVGAAVSAAAALARSLRRGRAATDVAHTEIVERTKAALAADPAASVSLGELARGAHTSEFHLARVFRARTGFTIRGYRNHLRLRLALERLADPGVDLARLACELGYAGHSHFTDSFRAAFGLPPSAFRRLGPADLRAARQQLERTARRGEQARRRAGLSPVRRR